ASPQKCPAPTVCSSPSSPQRERSHLWRGFPVLFRRVRWPRGHIRLGRDVPPERRWWSIITTDQHPCPFPIRLSIAASSLQPAAMRVQTWLRSAPQLIDLLE